VTTIPLKRMARIRYGLGQPPPEVDDGVPIIRATNISRGRIVGRGLMRARLEDLPLDRAPLLDEGEILVVRSGAYTGDSARITQEWAGSAPGYDLRVTPFQGDGRFLSYVFLSSAWMDQIELAKARAAQPHLNAEDLGTTSIPAVPLDEQTTIADYLAREVSEIDSVVGRLEAQIELLRERRQALIDSAVIGQIDVTYMKSPEEL
jgi:type I restriction enzyme, S subunit